MPRIFTDTNSPSSSRSAQSTFWLQNTNYLRLKNLQFGYTLPKSLLSNWGVENVRFYYSVENLFTIIICLSMWILKSEMNAVPVSR